MWRRLREKTDDGWMDRKIKERREKGDGGKQRNERMIEKRVLKGRME